MTSKTVSQSEIREHCFRQFDSVNATVAALCDYHHIYGPDRSIFTASWCGHLRLAVVELEAGSDEREFRIRRVINDMLADANEYSGYAYINKEMIIEGIIESGLRAYASHKRKMFKAKLAGDDNTYYGW